MPSREKVEPDTTPVTISGAKVNLILFKDVDYDGFDVKWRISTAVMDCKKLFTKEYGSMTSPVQNPPQTVTFSQCIALS